MGANQEIIAELRRVLNERDEAREQLDLTKRELGRWVDRETKAVRERESYQNRVARLEESIVTSLGQRLEPCMSRHPVTVVMAAGSLFFKIGEAMSCEFQDGDDLLEAVNELVRERDEARADLARSVAAWESAGMQGRTAHDAMLALAKERDEWRGKYYALDQTAGELCNACGWAFKIPGESCRCEVVKERDEARAEVERLRIETRDALNAMREQMAARSRAYKQGAEAMRVEIMQYLVRQQDEATVMVVDTAIKGVHKLSIPEEK